MESGDISNNKRIYDKLIDAKKLPSTCLLCSKGELKEYGHIIPKFVLRWLKLASKKEHFYLNNTDEKVSDTIALRILCEKCEDIFSKREKSFTDNYFKKYYRNKEITPKDEDIYFFALSIAWRILAITPMMIGQEDSERYIGNFREIIASYLRETTDPVEIDVYILNSDEIITNIPIDSYNSNLLKFSVRQGIFVQRFVFDTGYFDTLGPIPLVSFKLGAFYFIVSPQNYLQTLSFKKTIDSSKTHKVHNLKYSEELIGFLKYISNDNFFEIDESIIPENIKYNEVLFNL